ncbi:MAG TPA: nucleotidyltransferase domain-containing protein [Terriglobia bacterium]|jgi:predicted nucleotidyltransferase
MPAVEMSEREDEVLQIAVSILKHEIDPRRILLFGSRAEGTHRPGSDFDLAVDAPKPPDKAYRIREAVNDSVGLYSVDIVYLPDVEPGLRNLILNTGKVVYERKV